MHCFTPMAGSKIPLYKEEGKSYHADSCDPLTDAANRGELEIAALARGTYPGTPIPDNILPGLRSIGFWDATHDQNWGLPWHRNEGVEVAWLETGSMSFMLENKEFTLLPGNMTITRPWQPHKLGNPNIGVGRLHWIILDVGMRQPHEDWTWPSWLILTEEDIRDLTEFLRGSEKPVWDADRDIARCFKQIAATVSGAEVVKNASRLSVYINELFLNLLELFREQKVSISPSLSSARRSTELFLGAIRNDVAEPWTLKTMANHCGLCATRFSHYCKEITNLTPMQYLNQIRVEKASEFLISEPEQSVTEIAFACGFASSQYFATVFKQHHKCTPRQFKTKRAAR